MRFVVAVLALAALALLPTAAACGGISPGDPITAGDTGCTLAFLLADPSGLYFATAGHCVKVNQTVSTGGVTLGVGAFHYLVPETGSEQDGAPGDDFGLIRIEPDLYGKLNPKICGWNGPTGIYTEKPGGGEVRHYGYGLVLGDFEMTRPRSGYNLMNDNKAFYWSGAGLPGDSGSAVVSEDGRALGVLTHLYLAPPDTNGGTHLLRGFELAAAEGFNLRLVLAGEDPIQVLREVRANATKETIVDDGAPGSTNSTNGTTPTKAPPASGSNSTSTRPTSATTPATPGEPLQEQGTDDATKSVPGFEVALIAIAGLAALARKRRL